MNGMSAVGRSQWVAWEAATRIVDQIIQLEVKEAKP
jgi:hypothetical protein